MKVTSNTKKLVLWLVILILWSGAFTVINYTIAQHYGKTVATDQFDSNTTAYKELRTQKTVRNALNVVAVAGGVFFLLMAGTAFKTKKEEE